MQRPYSVPLSEIRREHVVLHSRFIATLAPAFNIDEARAFMSRIAMNLRMHLIMSLFILSGAEIR